MIDYKVKCCNKAMFPRWKRIAKPLIEAVRTIGFMADVWSGRYRPATHSVKTRTIRSWLSNRAVKTFIETGTFMGDTVLSLRHFFPRVISIEVDPTLYKLAKSRTAKYSNIEILLGDCVEELPRILKKIEGEAVFWLDGHWSGGVTGRGVIDDPIMTSLKQIASHGNKNHILFIDDARTFQGRGGGAHPRRDPCGSSDYQSRVSGLDS